MAMWNTGHFPNNARTTAPTSRSSWPNDNGTGGTTAEAGRQPRFAIGMAARRLLHQQLEDHGQQYAGQADHDEGHAPAQGLGQPPPGRGPEHDAQRHAKAIDSHGRGPSARLEIVADQTVRGWRAARLPDPDTKTAQGQNREIASRAAQGRKGGPDDQGHRQYVHPAHPLGEARDRNTQQGVEQGKIQSPQHADLGRGQAEFGTDRRADNRYDRAVDEIDRVGGQQQHQHQRAVAGCIVRDIRRRGRHDCGLTRPEYRGGWRAGLPRQVAPVLRRRNADRRCGCDESGDCRRTPPPSHNRRR